eukprot:scaffold319629_cov36-Tisochrysis_lutea.AAC.3
MEDDWLICPNAMMALAYAIDKDHFCFEARPDDCWLHQESLEHPRPPPLHSGARHLRLLGLSLIVHPRCARPMLTMTDGLHYGFLMASMAL